VPVCTVIGSTVPRRPAAITQADVRRILAAAKREGASEIELRIGGAHFVIKLGNETGDISALEEDRSIVL
jgi:hypothetical protein